MGTRNVSKDKRLFWLESGKDDSLKLMEPILDTLFNPHEKQQDFKAKILCLRSMELIKSEHKTKTHQCRRN